MTDFCSYRRCSGWSPSVGMQYMDDIFYNVRTSFWHTHECVNVRDLLTNRFLNIFKYMFVKYLCKFFRCI